jgi:hypothetical protein
MIGLIKKDLMLIVKSFSVVYILAVMAPLFVIIQNKMLFMPILTMLIAFMFALQVTTTMSLDESVKWRRNVTAMPILTFHEAASKYILTLLLAILSSIIVLIFGITIGINLLSIDINTIIAYTFLCFSIVLLYNTIIIPASYRYGTAKSRYFLMLFMAIPISIPYLVKIFGLDINIEIITDLSTFWMLLGLLSFVLLLLLISLLISIKILKRLDFSLLT